MNLQWLKQGILSNAAYGITLVLLSLLLLWFRSNLSDMTQLLAVSIILGVLCEAVRIGAEHP